MSSPHSFSSCFLLSLGLSVAWLRVGSCADTKKITYEDIDHERDVCEMGFHGSTIMNNTLWIHGGYVGYSHSGTTAVAPNTDLRAIDLTQSFPLTSRKAITLRSQPSNIPEVSAGALWSARSKLYEVGGHSEIADTDFPGYNNAPDAEMSVYDIITTGWSTRSMMTRTGSEQIIRSQHPLAIALPELTGKGYYLGGYPAVTAKEFTDNFSKLSVFDFATESWTRVLSPWLARSLGTLTHVPFGKNGLLVALGGFSDFDFEKKHETGGIPLTHIDILNLNTATADSPGTWSRPGQVATAANPADGVPSIRKNACAVAVAAADGSSAQIFLYGGSIRISAPGTQTAELWVLNIPSFEWFLLSNDTVVENGKPGAREGMTCDRVGSYMFMVGGRVLPTFSRECEATGMHALDLSTGEWAEEWDPEAAEKPYKVPQKVVDVIGGTREGGSTKVPTDGGWADRELGELFAAKAEGKTPKEKKDEGGTSRNGLSPGVVAGTAIAIVALIVLAGAAGYMFRRSRRNHGPEVGGMAELGDECKSPVEMDGTSYVRFQIPT